MKIINSLLFTIFSIVVFFATTFNVKAQIEISTLEGDDSEGSLIAAILTANAQNTDPAKPIMIRFAKNLSGEIVLSMDLPAIENHIIFAGNTENGKPCITINGMVNPAINDGLRGGVSPGFSLFLVKSGKTVTFENLHLMKSNRSGITNEGGTVTVKNCIFSYNMGIGNIHGTSGAIQNENGNLSIIGNFFFYNTGGVGGTDGGVGYGGPGCINVVNGNAVIINSSFFENEGGFGGVGVGSIGGAGVIMVREGNVSLINCTVAGNFGGGSIVTGASGGVVMIGGKMSIIQSTIVDNLGGAGLGGFDGVDFCSGGVHVLAGTINLGGNIIIGNHNGADENTDIESQASGEIHSSGHNLFGAANIKNHQTGDINGLALIDVVVTTNEGKYKSEIVSGFLPTIALTINSPAKSKSTIFTNYTPVILSETDASFFVDEMNKYSSLLLTDQNGKIRTANPSIGAVE